MRYRRGWFTVVLLICLCISVLSSIAWGAVSISVEEMISAGSHLLSQESLNLTERIFLEIRLPRAILSLLVGAILAVGGVLLQALFRNPIIEPGLIGTSSGAALGAAIYFVFGASLPRVLGDWLLPFCACCGAVLSTSLVVLLAQQTVNHGVKRTTALHLLLTGIAINALCLSGVGFLSYIARDPQARSISFWNMGALSGANWTNVAIVGSACTIGLLISLRFAKDLNALVLGEDDAAFLGVDVHKLKCLVLGTNVLMIAIATSFVGVIAFVGLIVPHILRISKESDHRFLISHAAVLGAIVLVLADLVARILVKPAELPIGVVTSLVGAPLFLLLLRRNRTDL